MADKKKQKKRGSSQSRDILRRLFIIKKVDAAFVFLFILLICVIFANVLVPYTTAIDLNPTQRLQSPNAAHWFGTDKYGRDMLSRIIYGSRVSLLIAFGSATLTAIFGTIIGTSAAYIGGKYDEIVTRVLDIWMAVPGFLVTLAIVAGLGVGLPQTLFALSFGGIPGFARVLRGQALAVSNQEFILSVKALGASSWRAMTKHVIPNVISQILIQYTSNVSMNLIWGTTLCFLGLGAQPPAPEWGYMLSEGMADYIYHPYLCTIPGAVISATALSVNIIGDGLRDALDPRLKA